MKKKHFFCTSLVDTTMHFNWETYCTAFKVLYLSFTILFDIFFLDNKNIWINKKNTIWCQYFVMYVVSIVPYPKCFW